MSYDANRNDLARRAAVFVDKILKGTKPADLPVEQPMKFEFVINLKAAKQIGLTIPPDVLARATKIDSVRRKPQRMSGHRMGRCSAESGFWQNRVNDRRWFGYKHSCSVHLQTQNEYSRGPRL